MAKPPEDMSTLWVRDEERNMRQILKRGARIRGQKSADFLRDIILAAVEGTEASFFEKRDRKIDQNERRECNHSTS